MTERKEFSPPHRPMSEAELFARFHDCKSTSKILLVLYSLVIGTRAQVIVDLGIGQTTGAVRAAARTTGGVVYSCDFDRDRYQQLLEEQDEQWQLWLEPSRRFIKRLPEPIDFVIHDAAHNYQTVLGDLEALLPQMRTFGMICVHDTQQPDLGREVLGAIRDATRSHRVSVTNLPFSAGLALIRVEEGEHPPIDPATALFEDGRPETLLQAYVTAHHGEGSADLTGSSMKTRFWGAAIAVIHSLKQKGLIRWPPRGR